MTRNKGRKILDDELYDEDDEDTQKDRYLTFRIQEEEYGMEICHVVEIIGMQRITDVPDMPDFVRGVINLRGQVIPVVDVRLRFGMEAREYDDRTCIIVASMKEVAVGLIVDTVKEVMDIPEEYVSPPPKIRKGPGNHFIKGMGKSGEDVKILLDVEKLLYESEMEELTVAQG